jgi:Na+(H+)/acetate symporter ActP
MKEALKKVFDKNVSVVVGVIILLILIFEYVVFPGLTAADTYINVLSFIIGLVSVLFVYHYIKWGDLIDFIVGKKEVIPPGETELDYIPKEEVVKKKRIYKNKSDKPSVKTKTKRKPKTTN